MFVQRSVGEIVSIIGAESSLDHSFLIHRIASLSQAGANDVAVLFERGDASIFNDITLSAIQKSKAGLIIASKPLIAGRHYLLVKDPLEAYQKLVTHLLADEFSDDSLVHQRAVIHEKAQLGDSIIVGAGAVIESTAKIGNNSRIGAQSYIGTHVIIGERVIVHPGAKILSGCTIADDSIIHANAVIGSDGFSYQVRHTGMRKVPQIGNVKIGRCVEIGANCSIDRDSFESTIIGHGVKLDNNVHIAHGVVIGAHTAILAHTGIAGGAKIGAGCQIGGQVGIKDHVTIGNGVKIVSKSAVIKDVADGQVIAGAPSVPLRQWKRIITILLWLPQLAKKAEKLERKLAKKQGFWHRLFG